MIVRLTGDGRSREVKAWSRWFGNVPPIREQFLSWSDELQLDPFHYNEAASVAALSNAAAAAGFLALTEYVLYKRHATRGRPFRNGRCDLWVADVASRRCWAFEVKQHFAAAKIRQVTFDARMALAIRDARAVDIGEADRRVACLIIVPRERAATSDLIEHFDQLCSYSDIAFRVGGGTSSIWLAFKFVA